MNLSVVTVTWNSDQYIAGQIRSVILGCEKISYEQIVVDNASTDDTVKLVRDQFPNVKLIKNAGNLGFAAANNIGASRATGEFLLFLNPDMQVTPGSLDALVNWMQAHTDVGIAGCKLVDADGKVKPDAQPRRFPRFWEVLIILSKLARVFPPLLHRYLYAGFDANMEQEVDTVRGSFMLMRRSVYEKLGWAFDPRYYIWFEDVDICREIKSMGLKVMYTPVILALDHVGVSFRKRNLFWKQWNFFKSAAIYFWKWRNRQ